LEAIEQHLLIIIQKNWKSITNSRKHRLIHLLLFYLEVEWIIILMKVCLWDFSLDAIILIYLISEIILMEIKHLFLLLQVECKVLGSLIKLLI
jgi:hypothetical protein